MVLRNKYDIFSFLGAICILFALMFMAFWYTCSLEVQDREMPKIQLPERSKVPPKVRFVPYPARNSGWVNLAQFWIVRGALTKTI